MCYVLDSIFFFWMEHLRAMPFIARPCPLLAKAPPNGRLTCLHPHSHSSYGSHCEFECNEGFLLRGASDTTCNSSGIWSQDLPTCQREWSCITWNHGTHHWSKTPSAPQPYSVKPSVFHTHPCLWTAPILWNTSVLAPSVFSHAKRDFPWTAHTQWCVPPWVSGMTHPLPA